HDRDPRYLPARRSADLTTTAATKGKVTDNGDGTFSYDPNGAFERLLAGQSATDSLLYTVTDAAGTFSTATVTITIAGQNDAPIRSEEHTSELQSQSKLV